MRRPTRSELVAALGEVGMRLDAIDRGLAGGRSGATCLTRGIGGSLDLETVLGTTLAAAGAVGPVDGGQVTVRKADGSVATVTQGLVLPGAPTVDGPPDGAAYIAARYAWEAVGGGLRSGIAVPFAGGSLAVYSRTADAFDERASSLLRAIADGAEPAVRNALEHLRVLEQAATDSRTGFGSARGLDQALPAAIASARRHGRNLCLIQIDLDDFGAINKELGNERGNTVLGEFGERMRAEKRDSDLIFRNSGGADEFFLILPETARDAAKQTYKRICVAVSAPYEGVGPVTMSSGLAELRADDTLQSLLERADNEMTRAKRTGKNRLCSDDGDTWIAPD